MYIVHILDLYDPHSKHWNERYLTYRVLGGWIQSYLKREAWRFETVGSACDAVVTSKLNKHRSRRWKLTVQRDTEEKAK